MIRMDATGALGQDASSFTTKDGVIYLTFSVAVNRGKDTPPVWIKCFKKEPNTKRLQYLTKGTTVLVSGTPSAESYFDKNKQENIGVLKLEAYTVEILAQKRALDDRRGDDDDLPM